jgi:uncharacterized protein (DUF488 family)
MAQVPIYTIGYGNRSPEEFLKLLQYYHVAYLVDVRSQPYSRMNPQFSRETLEKYLKRQDIRYMFMGDALGGRPKDDTCYVDGRVDYSSLSKKSFYQQGITRLRTAWDKQLRVAIMCTEIKPQECHRGKLIGNSLFEQHVAVAHIDENGKVRTQQEINLSLTDGQPLLFDQSPLAISEKIGFSRKRYSSFAEKLEG